MKKLAKVFGLLAVVICMGATLVACGGVTGTYKATMDVTAQGGPVITITLKLKSGDKFEMSATAKDADGNDVEAGEDMNAEGTYKVDGEKITLTVDGDSIEGTIKDGKITIDIGVGELTFKK